MSLPATLLASWRAPLLHHQEPTALILVLCLCWGPGFPSHPLLPFSKKCFCSISSSHFPSSPSHPQKLSCAPTRGAVVLDQGRGRSELRALGRGSARPPPLPEWDRRGLYLLPGPGSPFSFLAVQATGGRQDRPAEVRIPLAAPCGRDSSQPDVRGVGFLS